MLPEKIDRGVDLELARKIAAGDELAMETFLKEYRGQAIGMAKKILKCTDDVAEDFFQKASFRLWRKIKDYRGEAALSSYFIKIVINDCLMELRARKSDKRRKILNVSDLGDDADEHALYLNQGDHGTQAMRSVTRMAINKIIEQLPKGYRTVLVLHDIEGLQHDEIAELLGVSIGTSKSQLSKARQ